MRWTEGHLAASQRPWRRRPRRGRSAWHACGWVWRREPGRPRRLHLKDRRGAGTGSPSPRPWTSHLASDGANRRCSDGTAGRRQRSAGGWAARSRLRGRGGGDLAGVGARGMRAGGFPGNPGGLVVSILKTAGARAPAHQARGRGRRTWRPTERTAGARMVPPGEGNEARGDGRRGVGVSHSTAEAGELSPRDPVEGRGHRQVAPLEGKTANTPRLGPVSTSRQRIAELARQALGMAVAIAWLPGPAGTRRRVAKLSVEEPDAAEPARPDLWGARVSNDPGLPDLAPRGPLLFKHPCGGVLAGAFPRPVQPDTRRDTLSPTRSSCPRVSTPRAPKRVRRQAGAPASPCRSWFLSEIGVTLAGLHG